MILESLEMENFRQFLGKNAVQFTASPQKITIVFGENGRGKTGIYRAVMFCLFGERLLSQDGDQKGNIFLVNTTAVKQGAEVNESTLATVCLTFTHDNCRFVMQRTVKAIWSQNRQIETDAGVSLAVTTDYETNGNTLPIESPREIQDRINGIIDGRVKEFFLFDGERIETLTRADAVRQNDISKAVKQILNIDSLRTAIAALDRVKKAFDKEIQKNAKGDYGKYLAEKSECEEKIRALSKLIEEADEEEIKAQQRKEKIESQLKQLDGIRKKVEDMQRLEKDEKTWSQELDTQRGALAERIKCLAPFLCFEVTNNVFAYIDKKRQNKEIPSKVRAELIEELIAKHTCICGRPLEDQSAELGALQRWLTDIREQQSIDDSAVELLHQLDKYQKIGSERTNAHSALTTYFSTKKKIDEASEKRSEILEEIGDSHREDLHTFPAQLKKCENDIINFLAEKKGANDQIGECRDRIKELDDLISKEEKDKSLRGVNQKRRDLTEKAKKILEDVQRDYISDIRKRISRATEENLRSFLDEKSKDFFSRIEVDEKYALQIFNKHGDYFLADISAGQRQLLSLAFITALAQIASNNKLFQMPLFMDTPFGRLSLKHRQNLINRIPELCAQWVLLVTDTELRREEAREIEATKSLGHFYRLVSTDDGSTKIELIDNDRAISLLHEGKEVMA